MISSLKTILDIVTLRAGPDALPTSPRLLAGYFALLVLIQAGLSALLMPEEQAIFAQSVVSGLVTLGWLALLLRAFGFPARFWQTATAMFGVACVFAPLSIPLVAAIRPEPGSEIMFSPLAALAFALSIFLIYVNARILKAALERSMLQSVVLFVLGEMLVFAVMLALGFGETPA